MSQAPLTPHRTIAQRVKNLRQRRGLSAQRLADRLAGVGIPWDRSIVANLENGRRAAVSVEEFLALAYVLDVAPVHLLVPIDATQVTPYRVVPEGNPVGAWFARAWVRGQTAVGGVNAKNYFAEVPDVEWAPPSTQWTPEIVEAQSEATQRARDDGER